MHHFPVGLQSVLEFGIATDSIAALVLNIVVPKSKDEPEAELAEAMEDTVAAEVDNR